VAADQPAFGVTSGVSGTPGVAFNGVNHWMDLSGLTDASNDWTVYAILNHLSTGAIQSVLSHATGPVVHVSPRGSTASVSGYDSTSWRNTALAAATGEQYLCWVWDSSGPTLSVSRNGGAPASTAYDGTIPMAGATAALGAFHDGTQQWLHGIVSEVIVCNRVLPTEEQALLDMYLATRYP
jgi:hypothetical protein